MLMADHVPGVANAIFRNELDVFGGLVSRAHRVAYQLPVGRVWWISLWFKGTQGIREFIDFSIAPSRSRIYATGQTAEILS